MVCDDTCESRTSQPAVKTDHESCETFSRMVYLKEVKLRIFVAAAQIIFSMNGEKKFCLCGSRDFFFFSRFSSRFQFQVFSRLNKKINENQR